MENQYTRTELLIGKNGIDKLKKAKIAIFGIGGVGSFATEALARAGIGNFILIDHDVVSVSNINRQIIANHKTVGQYKVDVMKQRILDINPEANIKTYKEFYRQNSDIKIISKELDYVVDCIDTITSKIEIVIECQELNVPLISSMGAGNKLDPSKFEITDIYKTSICPLAKIMRKELRKRNISGLKVIYSKAEPIKPISEKNENTREKAAGSISFVPSVAGLMIAGEIIRELISD